jgi:alpha-galactosidase
MALGVAAHRGKRGGIVVLSCVLACDSSILLGARPGEIGGPDASPVDAPPPLDGEADGDSAAAEDCSASIPEGMLAATPPMGWNGWNTFECMPELNEAKVKAIVDAMAHNGMHEAGYQYVNLDDCWQSARAADGTIVVNAVRFPNGIEPISDYVHAAGFSFGLYSPTANCITTPGSYGFEDIDAQTYASWKADYFKYRVCSPPADLEQRYRAMASSLDGTGRPIVLSIAAPPFSDWMATVGQLWRTGPSITPTWDAILNALDLNAPLAAWTRPGGFTDPDMLEVGSGMLTEGENRAHFTLWAIMAAPLLAGNDLTTMSDATLSILVNHEVIALDQDPLGLQGALVRTDGDVQVYAKPLASCGARGVVFLNRGAAAAMGTISWPEVWLASSPAQVRNLWEHMDGPSVADGITVVVPPHDVVALRVTGVEPPRPTGEAYLSDTPWTYVANGFGPVERNTSNGESKPGDGQPIRLRGRTYEKGLGVHAPSLVRYRLQQTCTRFTADVGVDDETAGAGSVVFEVWSDGQKLYDSQLVTGTTPARHVDVDLGGKRDLRLFVGTGGDHNGKDHADWADARVSCR